MGRPGPAVGSALFFVCAPSVVAGLVPGLITRWESHASLWTPARWVGAILTAAAAGLVVACFARFVREGRGTPAPLAPTQELVVGGVYRHVRNPMYLGVVGAIAGQALLFASWALAAYGAAVWACTALFARYYEEPALLRAHGEQFRDYRAAVPAWLPRLRPWTPRAAADPRRRPN